MYKLPGQEELRENKELGEAMTGEAERVRMGLVGDEARNAWEKTEHADFYKTYQEVIPIRWKQRKGLKICKQNNGIIKFRLCKNHPDSLL